MHKFRENIFKISPILLLVGLFLFNIAEVKAMMSTGGVPAPNEEMKGVQVIIVSPPGIFNLPDSETSNFTQVCTVGGALNIVLDVAGKNKIEFEGSIVDMCDNEVIKNMDDYVQIEDVGEVSVRSDLLPSLKNKSANITMRNLPFALEPDIEVDGRPATEQDIENKKWDSDTKTLTFKAKHFTTYRAIKSSAELEVPVDGEVKYDFTKMFFAFIAIGLLGAGTLIYFLKNRKKRE